MLINLSFDNRKPFGTTTMGYLFTSSVVNIYSWRVDDYFLFSCKLIKCLMNLKKGKFLQVE